MSRHAIDVRIDELAAISSEPDRLTRLYLSPAHHAAAKLVLAWMANAGMTAAIDAVGNVVGRYEAAQTGARTLLLGSHIDTVRNAGKYDGNLGVLTAVAVVERLNADRLRLPFAIEVVAFGDEEGVRFPSTLGGSRAVAGTFDPQLLDEVDADGVTRRQALVNFGCDPGGIAALARDPDQVLGYVEVHIEQGPVLDTEACPLAVVSAINGATRGTVTVAGVSGHAGTVPMTLRRDALVAAAAMILAIEKRGSGCSNLVATVGRLEIADAATNTVPGHVSFTLDIRSPRDDERRAAVDDVVKAITEIAGKRGVAADVGLTYEAVAATCDARLAAHLAAAVAQLGLPAKLMPSGAGHDAMAFRGRFPFAMLFVRCRGGISHNPAESADSADIDLAVRALEHFVRTLQPA